MKLKLLYKEKDRKFEVRVYKIGDTCWFLRLQRNIGEKTFYSWELMDNELYGSIEAKLAPISKDRDFMKKTLEIIKHLEKAKKIIKGE